MTGTAPARPRDELLEFERRVQTVAAQIQAWATDVTVEAQAYQGWPRATRLEAGAAYERAAALLRETFPRRTDGR